MRYSVGRYTDPVTKRTRWGVLGLLAGVGIVNLKWPSFGAWLMLVAANAEGNSAGACARPVSEANES